MTVYDEYYLMSQIKRLEAELAEARAQIADTVKRLASPPAQPTNAALVAAVQFLIDRLDEYENEIADTGDYTMWFGHAAPALGRVRSLIAELTEPISDAGHTVADGFRYEMDQLRAQIAAKDAALRAILTTTPEDRQNPAIWHPRVDAAWATLGGEVNGLFNGYVLRIDQLEAELAEARKQIAAKDAAYLLAHARAAERDQECLRLEAELAAAKDAVASELGPYWSKWLDHWKGRAEKAEAQIAAKDAALQWYADMVRDCRKLPGIPEGEDARAALETDGGRRARAALAAPARETE